MVYLDQMILGAGHSILLSNFNNPSGEFNDHFAQYFNAGQISDFGLFSEKGSKDQISEDGFIEPVYRMLSEVVVAKKYNPTDFSTNGVLKKSMNLLKGQTVYTNHYSSVGNEVGVVKEVFWQDAFKQDGVLVPAGINAKLKIDAKSNEKLARGIMMDPPSVHSNSVSVTFAWEPSHKFKDLWEFYEKLGTYDEKGELIRRVVTHIVNYSETSLVSHGADPFAQKIVEGGKLNHIAHAATSYYGTMKNKQEDLNEVLKRNIYFGDFKSLDTLENGLITPNINHNTSIYNTKGITTQTNNNMEKENIENQQTEDTKSLDLSILFGTGLLTLAEGKEASLELAQEMIKSLVAKQTELQGQIDLLKTKASIADKYVDTLRNSTLEVYKKVSGGEEKADANILQLIGYTDVNVLESLNKSYQAQLNEKFKMKCSKCGSHDVSRSSSLSEEENEPEENHESTTENYDRDIIKTITKDKLNK